MGRFQAAATRASAAHCPSGPMKAMVLLLWRISVIRRIASAVSPLLPTGSPISAATNRSVYPGSSVGSPLIVSTASGMAPSAILLLRYELRNPMVNSFSPSFPLSNWYIFYFIDIYALLKHTYWLLTSIDVEKSIICVLSNMYCMYIVHATLHIVQWYIVIDLW